MDRRFEELDEDQVCKIYDEFVEETHINVEAYMHVVHGRKEHSVKAPEDKKRALESAKMDFQDVDKHIFEWLYILEEYRGDILDSCLQTLKYLQYEFFATSAHAISVTLPSRMEFRPMVEMTPEHLEAQVEMELQKSEEKRCAAKEALQFAFFSDTCLTPLSVATMENQIKMAELLMKYGADQNLRAKGLASPIMIARKDPYKYEELLSLFELGFIQHEP